MMRLIKPLLDRKRSHAEPDQGSAQPDHLRALISKLIERLGRKWSYALASLIMITEALLQMGKDGEMEVKEECRGKLKYLDERGDETGQDHLSIAIAVLENEPGKLN